MAKDDSIDLAGIRPVSIRKDGEFIQFEMETLAGKKMKFSCPAEAVSEIVHTLLTLAEAAATARGDQGLPVQPGTEMHASARALTSFGVSVAKNGQTIVLSLQFGPVLRHDISMPPHLCKQLGEVMVQSHKEWLKLFPPN